MAIVRKWQGDGLSAGTLSTSSAGTGDNAFSFVTGTTIVASGLRVPEIALADTSAAHQVRWNGLTLPSWGARVYFSWASGAPSASIGLVHGYETGGGAVFRVEMNTAGLLRLRNASAATWSQTTGALVAGTRYRLEVFGSAGSATVRVFVGESTSAVINQTAAVENLSIAEMRFGRHVSASMTGFTMDDLGVADVAAELGAVAAPAMPARLGSSTVTMRVGNKSVVALAQGDTVLWGDATPASSAPAGFTAFYSTDFSSNDGFSPDSGYVSREETQANDNSYNTSANVSFGASGLTILGKRESMGGRPYTTGDVTGRHINMPNYFRVDVDATLPTDYGMWPCPLWLRPNNNNNGGNGELDLCETWTYDWGWNAGKTAYTNAVSHSTMWRDYVTASPNNKTGAPLAYSALPNPDPAARHTYTCIKTVGRLEYLIDGVRVYCWQAGATYNAGLKIGPPPTWYNSVYEVAGQTWYPRFTLQLGGANTDDPLPGWTQSAVVMHAMRIYVPS